MAGARLEVVDRLGSRVVSLDKAVFTIGRRDSSDLCLPSPDISRLHAEIVLAHDHYVIRDRSSTGTFVNDTAVMEAPLKHGDRIRLGPGNEARLIFLSDSDRVAPAGRQAAPPPAFAAAPAAVASAAAVASPPGETPATESAVHDLRQMAALFEGLRAMGSAHALDEALALVLDLTIECTGADRGFIMLANAEGRLEFTLGRAAGRVTLPGKTFETSRRIPEEVFATGQARTVSDLLDGDMSRVHTGTIALGIRHVQCLPLRLVRYAQRGAARDDRQKPIGVLYLDSRHKGMLLSDATRAGLETLATEAAVAIENARLYRQEIEKHRLEQDLNIAAEIQQALLPRGLHEVAGVRIAAVSVPCRAIGGDFFDYVELPDNRGFGFALGDVSGKGAPAALLTASVQGVFSTRAADGESPAHTLTSVNKAVIRRGVDGRFVTMIYGVVDPDGRLTYCNAGHNPPLVIGRRGQRRLERGGMVLGLFPQAAYEEETLQLDPADVIVTFSDGVSESENTAGEQYEEHRIVACVQRHLDLEPAAILDALLADVRRFSEGTAPQDDLTAMVLRYMGRPS